VTVVLSCPSIGPQRKETRPIEGQDKTTGAKEKRQPVRQSLDIRIRLLQEIDKVKRLRREEPIGGLSLSRSTKQRQDSWVDRERDSRLL